MTSWIPLYSGSPRAIIYRLGDDCHPSGESMRARIHLLVPIILACLPILWAFQPLLQGSILLLGEGHGLLSRYPLHMLFGQSLQRGQLPMITALLEGGLPLMATGEVGVMHPLNLLAFRYLDPGLAWSAMQLLSLLFTFVSGRWLGKTRGFSEPIACLSGLIGALGGASLAQLEGLPDALALPMLPLGLTFGIRYVQEGRLLNAGLAGACLAMTVLAGSSGLGLVLLLILPLTASVLLEPSGPVPNLEMLLLDRRGIALRLGLFPVVAVGVAVLVAAPQLMLTWDWLPHAAVLRRTGSDVGSASLTQVLAWLISPLGNPGTTVLPGPPPLYVGILPLLLAFLAPLLAGRRGRRLLFPLLLSASGVLLLPLGPMLCSLTGPVRLDATTDLLLPSAIGLGLLAGHGTQSLKTLLDRHPHALGRVFAAGLPLLILCVTGVDLGAHAHTLCRWLAPDALKQEVPTVKALPGLGHHRLFSVAGGTGWSGTPSTESPFLAQQTLFWPNLNVLYKVAAVGAQVSRPHRLWYALEQTILAGLLPKNSVPPNASSSETSAREVDLGTVHLLQAAGVRIVASYFTLNHPLLLPLVEVQVPGLTTPARLYGIEDPLPRAWLARSLRACTWETAIERLKERHIGPGWSPCLISAQDDPAPDESAAMVSFLEPIARGEQVFELKVSTRKEVWVIQRELWAPGWIALVDGVPQDVMAADGIYRAARVPAGEHNVRFEYRPRGMNDGLLLNMLGIALLGLLTLLRGRSTQGMESLPDDAPGAPGAAVLPGQSSDGHAFLPKSDAEWYN